MKTSDFKKETFHLKLAYQKYKKIVLNDFTTQRVSFLTFENDKNILYIFLHY